MFISKVAPQNLIFGSAGDTDAHLYGNIDRPIWEGVPPTAPSCRKSKDFSDKYKNLYVDWQRTLAEFNATPYMTSLLNGRLRKNRNDADCVFLLSMEFIATFF